MPLAPARWARAGARVSWLVAIATGRAGWPAGLTGPAGAT